MAVNLSFLYSGRTGVMAAAPLFTVLVLLAVQVAAADQTVISDDGREIRLNADGTWEFLSQDRFANTREGQRIRLKADNTWEYVGNAPLRTEAQFRSVATDIQLQQVVIESTREKSHKNTRKKTHTVFYLEVGIAPAAKAALKLPPEPLSRLRVVDSKGKDYPVVSISPAAAEVAPGDRQRFEIRADGSPQWWGIKNVTLTLAPELFGNRDGVVLRRAMSDIDKRDVDALP